MSFHIRQEVSWLGQLPLKLGSPYFGVIHQLGQQEVLMCCFLSLAKGLILQRQTLSPNYWALRLTGLLYSAAWPQLPPIQMGGESAQHLAGLSLYLGTVGIIAPFSCLNQGRNILLSIKGEEHLCTEE